LRHSKDILNISVKGDILICGDLNARTGSDVDFIPNDTGFKYSVDDRYIDNIPCRIRNSQDMARCNRGKNLLELCIQSKLRILNGRTFGDLQGKYTAHCSLRSSVIDYTIASKDVQHKILSMKVHDFKKSISNHCMLSCILSVNFIEICAQETTPLSPHPTKYIWSKDSVNKFQQSLKSTSVTSKLNDFVHSNYSLDSCSVANAVLDFSKCIVEAAGLSLKARQKGYKRNKRKRKNKPWFNTVLHDMKMSLDYYSKLLAFRPFDKELRHKCFTLSRKYYKTRKEKRRTTLNP